LLVSYRNTLGYSRLGVAIGRKTGKAVVRNRLKRRIREIFRRDGSIDALSRDIVIVVRRKSVGGLCFAALRNDFKTCITQLNLRC
jgi:ribonuclease P protein component